MIVETDAEMKRFKASFFLTAKLLSYSCAIAASSGFASSSSLYTWHICLLIHLLKNTG